MPKQIPIGKEIFYTYIIKGYKKKLAEIAKEKGLNDTTALTNLIFTEYIQNHEARNTRKLR